MKIVRLRNNLTVILNDGTTLISSNCTDEMYESIKDANEDQDAIKAIMIPEFFKKKDEAIAKKELLEGMSTSRYLTVKGASIYLESVSQLSLPEDLAVAIYQAEKEEDVALVNTYLNFWTLASLNPDSRARTNLFWFLKKYGMTISSSGLFVAYRNVVVKNEGSEISSKLAKRISKAYAKVKMKWKKSPKNFDLVKIDGEVIPILNSVHDTRVSKHYGNLKELYNKLNNEDIAPTYTDGYTGKFTIKIGEPVTMPRHKCDSVQENTCSRGLHVAGREWLQSGYFGNISLVVLVNPADVVAVPPSDSYGKMRTCAYYPVAFVERDEEGNIINDNFPDGFEDDFMEMITYQGEINNEEQSSYQMQIPHLPELNADLIYHRLDSIKLSLSKKLID